MNIPNDLLPARLPSAPFRNDWEASAVLRLDRHLTPTRPMSLHDLADQILKELQLVGNEPFVTELALWARHMPTARTLAVRGEWEVANRAEPDEITNEIEERF